MKEICENVYIGNREDGLECLGDKYKGIGFILTLDTEPLIHSSETSQLSDQHDIILKHVECLDEPETDLLSYFDDCVEFIKKGLEKSKVLVHCLAGVSRSATIILAFIMKTQNIDLSKAVEELKMVYPKANPNPGFLYQLQLFEAMDKQVDTHCSLYKQFRLQILANDLEKTGCKQVSHEILNDLTTSSTGSVLGTKGKSYKCRKCRCQLFKCTNVLGHIPGTGQEFLPWYKKSFIQKDKNINKNSCTSYFVEPIKWMEPFLLGTLQGKVSSALVEGGSHLHFNSIKAELMKNKRCICFGKMLLYELFYSVWPTAVCARCCRICT